jgi:acyl carrier protein
MTMALTAADVLAGLKEIVEEVAGVSASQIELEKNFTEDLDVDSLSMVEVVVAAEERFGVKIPDDAVTDLATVGDAVNFIVNAAK